MFVSAWWAPFSVVQLGGGALPMLPEIAERTLKASGPQPQVGRSTPFSDPRVAIVASAALAAARIVPYRPRISSNRSAPTTTTNARLRSGETLIGLLRLDRQFHQPEVQHPGVVVRTHDQRPTMSQVPPPKQRRFLPRPRAAQRKNGAVRSVLQSRCRGGSAKHDWQQHPKSESQ